VVLIYMNISTGLILALSFSFLLTRTDSIYRQTHTYIFLSPTFIVQYVLNHSFAFLTTSVGAAYWSQHS
jgi:hypothetical protein